MIWVDLQRLGHQGVRLLIVSELVCQQAAVVKRFEEVRRQLLRGGEVGLCVRVCVYMYVSVVGW